MGKTLVIVESPTKARTIKNFLPDNCVVEASMGSVRDLPAKAADIPEKLKKEKWTRLGVNVEDDFSPLYIVSSQKKKVIKKLKDALKGTDELIIATDEDREGESIGWHLLEVLKPKVPVKRMVFHEITKSAVQEAIKNTRVIDDRLVRAQETRRILDRLVGYTISPLLWKKIARGLSAGRVQSVAVRLLVTRERDRRAFHSGTYWDLSATLADGDDNGFQAIMTALGGLRLATGKDFDPDTGKISKGKKVLLLGEEEATKLRQELLDAEWSVSNIEEKEESRNPAPPFITSTLQQEANRKLSMTARRTMRIAQKLYERGLITYMRTDSVNLSESALNAIRKAIAEKYGNEYINQEPRRFKTKSKGAQEAHEAIRPAGESMPSVGDLKLDAEEAALYDLIWKRTIATQMANARLQFVTATLTVKNATFRASGKRVLFPGFFRAYVEGADDPDAVLENRDIPLPDLKIGDGVNCRELEAFGHKTKPPARYTEASLVQALEREGIGRPSTYASIIGTIQDRGYVCKQGGRLVPTFTAMAVTGLLEDHFPDLVDLRFTARMEDVLDEIASGDAEWLPYLDAFYKGDDGLAGQVKLHEEQIDARKACRLQYDDLGEVEVRVGRYGAFLETQEDGEPLRASLPDDLGPADLSAEAAQQIIERKLSGDEAFAHHPGTDDPIYVKVGPYGAYVQLGDEVEGAKAVRTSLPKGITPENITVEQAVKLLELPRSLGTHPETGKEVKAGIGRFGPFLVHEGVYASLKGTDDVLNIELPRALELLEFKRLGKRGLIRIVGDHPEEGEPIEVYSGRFGPYVKHNGINASIPKDVPVENVTIEQAVAWLKEKKITQVSTDKKKKRK